MSLSDISNLSYTNKDFNSIYSELLECAKNLSYKWDPTASDESDPGLVLLKLAAIIGDKDSYNIDKNVLELMPASVTQMPAARQIFEQCGYTMRYYRSATDVVNVTIKKDLGSDLEEGAMYTYRIPRFTMFCDSDSTVVYTSTEEITVPVKTEISVPVIEGTIINYTVNNDSLITMQNLDSRNRLYFTETNIAENGIFITNVDSDDASVVNYEEWTCVENLQTQTKGTRCYKFGTTIDNSLCYIEFPDDIEFLIEEGLNISYILTSGSNGNVSAGNLKQFYTEAKFTRITDGTYETAQVDATIENVVIKNPVNITNGQDPQTIDEAYKDYRRVQDTFKTLVSLKDYSDYLITSGEASNGYVCDRTNDIQRSYKIVKTEGDVTFTKTVVDQNTKRYKEVNDEGETLEDIIEINEPTMDAFDLCVYAFDYVPTVTSETLFKKSFQLVNNKGDFVNNTDLKCMQHDFLGFDAEKILLLKNKYPLTASIIPRYKLSQTEQFQVIYNVERALQNALNSNKVSFGEELSVEMIQQTIITADERIKTIVDFDSPSYETYAVYKVSEDKQDTYGEFHELRIDNESDDGGYVPTSMTSAKYSQYKDNLYTRNKSKEIVKVEEEELYDSSKKYFTFDSHLSELWNKFRVEIYAKNVLAGVCPLYADDNTYKTTVSQKDTKEYQGIKRIDSITTIELDTTDTPYKSPELDENEHILLTLPNFIQENNFSTYVKIVYDFPSIRDTVKTISDGSKLELGQLEEEHDFIVFLYKSSENNEYYDYIKYDNTEGSLAKFISPQGFNLPTKQDLSSTKGKVDETSVVKYFADLKTGRGLINSEVTPDSPFVGDILDPNKYISDYLNNDSKCQSLTGTRIINTLNINKILVNNKENGCKDVYWIMNNENNTLFSEDQESYVLKSGEYFIYTNDEKSVLHLQGEGTLIERVNSDKSEWSISRENTVTYSDLMSQGINILSDKWVTIKKTNQNDNNTQLWSTEQQLILIGPKNTLMLTKVQDPPEGETVTKEITNTPTDIKYCAISYIDEADNTHNVPSIVSSNIYWKATSILNINMSSEKEQLLKDNQILKLYTEEGPLETPITDCFIQSSNELNLFGGSFLDVGSLSSSGVVSFMTYQKNEDKETTGSSIIHQKEATLVTFDKDGDFTITLDEFKLLPGKYLLQLEVSDDIILNFDEGKSDLTPFERIQETKTYKAKIDESSSRIELKICGTAKRNSRITIPPLFRYTDENLTEIISTVNDENSTVSFEDLLLSKIAQLDFNSDFNYTYRPKTNIDNPLESKMFLRKDHFFKKFTICEWDAIVEKRITVQSIVG